MPRACTICQHPSREAINRELAAHTAIPALGAKYRVSPDALLRHRANHFPAVVAKAQAAMEVAEADDLLAQVRALQSRALTILDKAEAAGDLRTALTAIREARGNLELLARLLGELQEGATVNVLVSPAWLQVRTVIVQALVDYPEAQGAVVAALSAAGGPV